MRWCHTNCIEKPVSKVFGRFGRLVGEHPWWFLIIPLFISAGLGGGFYFLDEMERKATGIENQFTPVNGLAKEERLVVKTNFPQDDDQFSRQRLYTEGTYGSLIFTTTDNILRDSVFRTMSEINNQVLTMEVEKQTFSSICVLNGGMCVNNIIFQFYDSSTGLSNTITYPFNESHFLGTEIGGVQLRGETDQILSARAIRLYYFLKEDNVTLNNLWLKEFLNMTSKMNEKDVDISYFTSLSREEEFQKNSDSIIPLFSVTYTLVITFSILSCIRLDCVRNKVWLAVFGVLSAGMAVLSSFGLLLYCGMPFSMTVATAPFLILGIGVDDMFIMISCWQQTRVKDKVEDRMAATYKEAAVSITITTLTDALAFYIGLLTPFRSVQSFCMYTGTAVVFCFLYNITFFGAFLALDGRRENSNRHWFTCLEVPQPESEKYNMCCVGGVYDPQTGSEEPIPVSSFIKKYYGPFLTNKWTKMMVILLYAGYLATGIYYCFKIQEGIELKNLAPDGSYLGNYYDDEDQYFSDYGPRVMVVVTDRDFKYWDQSARDQLDTCLQAFGNLTIEDRSLTDQSLSSSWLHEYIKYGTSKPLNLNDRKTFIDNLPAFFSTSPTNFFRQDVNFSITDLNIYASRMFIQTVNIRTATDERDMLNKLRETAESDVCPGSLRVYHPSFIFFDQYAVIVINTIMNLVIATLAMLAVSLMLIPSPICSLWVTFAIVSVIVGVAGFMTLWDVNLDSVSMINLIICIGFSVDFSAHISYAFVSSKKSTANEKAIYALVNLGYPIIQGALSTILGVVVLSAAESYIFRTFFKIMFLVIIFGAVHGVVFLPVVLTFFGTCGAKVYDSEEDGNPNTSQSRSSRPIGISLSKTINGIRSVVFDPDCPESWPNTIPSEAAVDSEPC